MQLIEPGDEPVRNLLPPAPPPPAPIAAPPPPPVVSAPPAAIVSVPSQPAAQPRNANGETLAEAEAAVLAEVANGALGADALARHPLPPGTSTAEALRFLASIPQTTYQFGEPGGVVTGPPIGTVNPPADPSVDLGGGGGDDRSLESAYKPAGLKAVWRDLIDVFKVDLPKKRGAVTSVFDTPKELFR